MAFKFSTDRHRRLSFLYDDFSGGSERPSARIGKTIRACLRSQSDLVTVAVGFNPRSALRPERPSFDSPGQSPGFGFHPGKSPVGAKQQLTRPPVLVPPFQGLVGSCFLPRALPWAIKLRPVGAGEITIQDWLKTTIETHGYHHPLAPRGKASTPKSLTPSPQSSPRGKNPSRPSRTSREAPPSSIKHFPRFPPCT